MNRYQSSIRRSLVSVMPSLWRVAILLVLAFIAVQLVIGNRTLKRISSDQIVDRDLGGIEESLKEGLDGVKQAIDNLPDEWKLRK